MKKYAQLKNLNTFSVNAYADQIITVYNEFSLLKFWREGQDNRKNILILGQGSNVLFLENYKGIILLNRIKGIYITESNSEWKLHVGAGEKWHELVVHTIDKNIPGLENLACIPGCVGASPIQNIGAYGIELSQICEYVDVLELNTGHKIRFSCNECCFQYRGSIFKFHLYKYAILFVGLKLNKCWKPILGYSDLNYLDRNLVTPRQILNTIIKIRSKKLPNPVIHGNAGSFFKNPIIDSDVAHFLFRNYPTMPYYQELDGRVKLLAGWLIEHCELKGYVLGEASVYDKQALILINRRQKASGTEIAALAFYIHNKVANKFNIYLEPEVRLIGSTGEINSEKLFKN